METQQEIVKELVDYLFSEIVDRKYRVPEMHRAIEKLINDYVKKIILNNEGQKILNELI